MIHRFQMPNFRVSVPGKHPPKFGGAVIPDELSKAGLDASLLRDAYDLAFKFGISSERNPGLRTISLLGNLGIAVSEDEKSCFMHFGRKMVGEHCFIPVVPEGGGLAEAVIWDKGWSPQEVQAWIASIDAIFRMNYLIHPTTGLRFDTQGKGLGEARISPDWYFSETGAYIIPSLYGHNDCEEQHFVQANLLARFRTERGELALCRLVDRDLAILRAQTFTEVCTKFNLGAYNGEDEALCELRMRADDRFEELRVTRPSSYNLIGINSRGTAPERQFFCTS